MGFFEEGKEKEKGKKGIEALRLRLGELFRASYS
jgi:hypothetical protein